MDAKLHTHASYTFTLFVLGGSFKQLPLRIPPDLRDHVEKHMISKKSRGHILHRRENPDLRKILITKKTIKDETSTDDKLGIHRYELKFS